MARAPGSALQASEIRRLRFTHDLHAHHRQQARKHRRMNTLRIPRTTQRMRSLLIRRKLTNLKRRTRSRNRIANLELEFLAHLTQLRDQILPLTDAQPTQILSLANPTKRGIARLATAWNTRSHKSTRSENHWTDRHTGYECGRPPHDSHPDVRGDPANLGTRPPPALRPTCSAWSTSQPR